MSHIIQKLKEKQLISPPTWLPNAVDYLTMMGSVAYGVSSDTSDCDVYGCCMPPKSVLFPHLNGEIVGFSEQKKRFCQYQEHHVNDKESRKEYDFSIYNIAVYFRLLMENNPNIIDSIFTPNFCVLYITQLGQIVRDNRHLFLHKGAYHKFKGYMFSQLHKMFNKGDKAIIEFEDEHDIDRCITFAEVSKQMSVRETHDSLYHLSLEELKQYHSLYEKGLEKSKRFEQRKINGFDVKFAYHIIRLADECEQILEFGDLNLQRAKEHMKAVRKGEISQEEIKKWCDDKVIHLEKLYHNSSLQHSPDKDKIQELLFQCLEHHYGNLDKVVVRPNKLEQALKEIGEIISKLNL